LTEGEVTLLSKGLKFIPKPSHSNNSELTKSFEDYSRRIKLADFFEIRPSPDQDPKSTLFTEKSTWIPPDHNIRSDILKSLNTLEEELSDIPIKNVNSNLTKIEQKAIKSLKQNGEIVIKSADKGSSVVILDKSDYLKEGHRQLSNPVHYKKLTQPVHPMVSNKVNKILNDLKKKKTINNKQFNYLQVPTNPRNRRLYLLPKIHKPRDQWLEGTIPPGRPIVSDCDSDTYRVSEYIDHFLAPLAVKHDSYLKDTPDFLKKLGSIKPQPNCLLITLDVESLYTNIDNNDGIKTVTEAFLDTPDPNRPDQALLELLQICLENNDFQFDKEWFLQIWGTAMGKKFAPNYANLFLAKWEKLALSKCNKHPKCFLRFLDDIFIIWEHSEEEFWEFFNTLNNQHPTIKLKATISRDSINFLDVTIFKGKSFRQTHNLDTKVYFKPTDTHELLHKHSYHPKHTFKGILKSQILRFHRICSHKEDFDNACTTLFRTLKDRGYSSRFLRTIKNDTLQTMGPKGISKKCDKQNCLTCPYLVTTDRVTTRTNNTVFLKDSMNCQSTNVIYLIKCSNCHIMYVGESQRTLHLRFTEHRSKTNTKKDCPVANHFNNVCPNLSYLQITPLEIVPRTVLDTFMGLIDMKDLRLLWRREQFWINKLKTLEPFGLNKRREVRPPVIFSLKFCDQTGQIQNIVKKQWAGIKTEFRKTECIIAHKKNKNLKDLLVSSNV